MYVLSAILILISVLAFYTGVVAFWQGGGSVPGGNNTGATIDSELRFYSAYWLGYGVFCLWVAVNLPAQLVFVPWLAGVLLLSGLGRLLSFIRIGRPEWPFVPYMIAEFVLAFVVLALWLI